MEASVMVTHWKCDTLHAGVLTQHRYRKGLLVFKGLPQSSDFFWNKLKAGLHFCLLCTKENMFITLQHRGWR